MSPNGIAPDDVAEVEVPEKLAARMVAAIRRRNEVEARLTEAHTAMMDLIGLYLELSGVEPARFLGTRGTEQGGLVIAYRKGVGHSVAEG